MRARRTCGRVHWTGAGVVLLTLSSCVFPANLTSGIELSWIVVESNGDEAERRARSCEGGLIDRVSATVTDLQDEKRTSTFEFACEEGFQSDDEFVSKVSDIFFDLRAGKYDLTITATDLDGDTVYEQQREVRIDDRRAKVIRVEIEPARVDLHLELTALDACGNLGGWLVYEDPLRDLADPQSHVDVEPDEDTVPDLPYREALEADRGLRLDGSSRPCDGIQAGIQTFAGLDPGRYVLVLNGLGPTDCRVPVVLEPGASSVSIALDLANPPC